MGSFPDLHDSSGAGGDNDIDFKANQLGGKLGETISPPSA
jgi:hypothetical protein